MKTYPLESISLEEAKNKQFKMVNEITSVYSGSESLSRGDLGVNKEANKPKSTLLGERAIANFFGAERACLVRGAGTGAIRFALQALLKPCDEILVHTAPIYPTTQVSFDAMGLKPVRADFNDIGKLENFLKTTTVKVALVQLTRQQIEDSYNHGEVISLLKKYDIKVITDDNYAVMKVAKIGCEVGADISCFSCFKLLGPEGVGCVCGAEEYIYAIQKMNYSGGGQVQGWETQEALRGLVFVPVLLAIQSEVNESLVKTLQSGKISGVKDAFLANAQSKVLIVELEDEIAPEVISEAEKLGGLPNPVGAESKYEISPMFYRVSGTFLKADPTLGKRMIRINPNRSGAETILNILEQAIKKAMEK